MDIRNYCVECDMPKPCECKDTELHEKVRTLYSAIEHGDEEHKKWLKQKIDEHFNL